MTGSPGRPKKPYINRKSLTILLHQIKMIYVKITDRENPNPIEVPTEDDGSISLSTITGRFPRATGLCFTFNVNARAVKINDGKLYALVDGWGDLIYRCVFPTIPTEKNKNEEITAAGSSSTEDDIASLKRDVSTIKDEMKEIMNGFGYSLQLLL